MVHRIRRNRSPVPAIDRHSSHFGITYVVHHEEVSSSAISVYLPLSHWHERFRLRSTNLRQTAGTLNPPYRYKRVWKEHQFRRLHLQILDSSTTTMVPFNTFFGILSLASSPLLSVVAMPRYTETFSFQVTSLEARLDFYSIIVKLVLICSQCRPRLLWQRRVAAHLLEGLRPPRSLVLDWDLEIL